MSWWLAEPHPKADQLLMRHATAGDVKLPGSARRSKYYKRYGNPNLTPTDLRCVVLVNRVKCMGPNSLAGQTSFP